MHIALKLILFFTVLSGCRHMPEQRQLPEELQESALYRSGKPTLVFLVNPYTCQACNAETSLKITSLLEKDKDDLNKVIISPAIRKVELEQFFTKVIPIDPQEIILIADDALFRYFNSMTGSSTKINYIFVYDADCLLRKMQAFEQFDPEHELVLP